MRKLFFVICGIIMLSPPHIFSTEKIVFTKEYYYNNPPIQGWFSDIWVVNIDGTAPCQLTNLGPLYTAETPMLSPDGEWVLFSSSYNSWQSAYYKDIFIVSTNGTQLTRVSGNQHTIPMGYCTIEGIILDDTQKDPLNEIQINITYQGSNQFYHPVKVTDRIFSYSISNVPVPEGGKIWVKCCVRQYVGDLIFPVVYAGQVNTITEEMHLKDGNYTAECPTWSPDMSEFCALFSLHSYDPVDSLDRSATNISIWEINGTQLNSRSISPPYDCSPRYSPDGTKIAFGYGNVFQQSLVTIPANNLNAAPDTLVLGYIDYINLIYYAAVFPAWSPDGNWVAFTYQGVDGYMNIYGAIYMIKTDLSDTIEIVPFTQNTYACFPSFSMDGTKIIYSLMTSKSSYLNLLADVAAHNYTVNIWEKNLVKGKNVQITTDGLSTGSFCGDFNPPVIEENIKPVFNVRFSSSPNPFHEFTTVKYSLLAKSEILLNLFDVSGKYIKTITSGEKTAGQYEEVINMKDLSGGIYFLKLTTNKYDRVEKIVLLK